MDLGKRMRNAFDNFEPGPYGGGFDMPFKQARPDDFLLYPNPANQMMGYGAQQPVQSAAIQHPSEMLQQSMQPQGLQSQGMQLAGMQAQGMQAPGIQPQGIQTQGMQAQGMYPQGMQQQGLQLQGMQPQGFQQQGIQPQGFQQQGMQGLGMQQQGMMQQGVSIPGFEAQSMQAQGMQPQSMSGAGMIQQGMMPQQTQPQVQMGGSTSFAGTMNPNQMASFAGLTGAGPASMDQPMIGPGVQGMGMQGMMPMGQQQQQSPWAGQQQQQQQQLQQQSMISGVAPVMASGQGMATNAGQQPQGMLALSRAGSAGRPQSYQQQQGAMNGLQQQHVLPPQIVMQQPVGTYGQQQQQQQLQQAPAEQQVAKMGTAQGQQRSGQTAATQSTKQVQKSGAAGTGNGVVTISQGVLQQQQQQQQTEATASLYFDNLPADVTRRELAHVFRPYAGYKDLRLVVKDVPNRSNEKSVKVFVDFSDIKTAAAAMAGLSGYRFDLENETSCVLRPIYARPPKEVAKGNRSMGQNAVLDPPPPNQGNIGGPSSSGPKRGETGAARQDGSSAPGGRAPGPHIRPGAGTGNSGNVGPGAHRVGPPMGSALGSNTYIEGGFGDSPMAGPGPAMGPMMVPFDVRGRGPEPTHGGRGLMHEGMGLGPGGLLRMRAPGPDFGGRGMGGMVPGRGIGGVPMRGPVPRRSGADAPGRMGSGGRGRGK